MRIWGIKLTPTVLGNLLQALSMVIAVFMAWNSLTTDVAVIKTEVKYQAQRLTRIEDAMLGKLAKNKDDFIEYFPPVN